MLDDDPFLTLDLKQEPDMSGVAHHRTLAPTPKRCRGVTAAGSVVTRARVSRLLSRCCPLSGIMRDMDETAMLEVKHEHEERGEPLPTFGSSWGE